MGSISTPHKKIPKDLAKGYKFPLLRHSLISTWIISVHLSTVKAHYPKPIPIQIFYYEFRWITCYITYKVFYGEFWYILATFPGVVEYDNFRDITILRSCFF